MIDIDMMQDASEIIHYDRQGIPLYIHKSSLSSYTDMRALCHWHEDIEFIYVKNGMMNYAVNEKKIVLKENDCILVNSRQMHYGYSSNRQNCDFACILFHPSLFTGCRRLYDNYVASVIENQTLEYLYFDSSSPGSEKIITLLRQIIDYKEKGQSACEMEIVGTMHLLWSRIYKQNSAVLSHFAPSEDTDVSLQKKMVSYIYQHYTEKVTLDDIARSGNVSRSKCCGIFRRYLGQSPIDFLNAYRLSVSCNLLQHSDAGITDIALACGFNHLSYFSKMFFRHYGCTPRDFRVQSRLL